MTEVEYPDWSGDVIDDLEQDRRRFDAELALAVEEGLRSRRNTLWPQLTGFSRDRFRVEAIAGKGEFLIINTAPYASAVEFREHYAKGKRNPNFQAALRTIFKDFTRSVATADQRAD